MDYIIIIIGSIVLGFCAGSASRAERITEDCKTAGYFIYEKQIHQCKIKAPAL